MAEYSIESQVPPISIKAMKALGVEQPRLLLTQEELNSPVVTGGDHLKDKNRMFYGDKAVAEVERRLGEELPEHYKRIVREEGFFSGRYLDDAEVPVVTAGVGQTGPYINAPLSNVFESKAKQVRAAIPHYDKLPDDVKGAVLSAQYRGDLLPEHNWVKQFNKGNYGVAADSFLNHKEYKSRKAKDPNDGVVKRMDDIAHILRSYE
jgi:hypothetical protein